MNSRQLSAVVRYIRKLVGTELAGEPIDRALLERFATGREEAAFEELVQRHGPMVLGVCRRVLQDVQDAEDVFQATFLVLIRKAASLDRRGSLAGWLYTVAYHLALKAKANAFRRRVREKQLENLSAPESAGESIWWELRPILDEEVNRLPDKYRAAIVLCYLEGKTNEEAAQELGCPFGTVSSRLARGRDLLRNRLTRRGLAFSSGLFVTALTQNAVPAAVPGALVPSTVKAALLYGASTAAEGIAKSVAVLADGMLKAMFVSRLKIAAAVLLVLGVAGLGMGALLHSAWADKSPPAADNISDSTPPASRPVEMANDPECLEHKPLANGPNLVAQPGAFQTLVRPDCSHCRDEAKRRQDLLAGDRVLCWLRGEYDGGAIPFRFLLNSFRVISDKYGVFVYDPDAGYARGFAPSVDFSFHGWRNGVMVIRHADGTLYSGLTGIAFEGPNKGSRLAAVPTLVSDWGFWLQQYPGTVAYRMLPQYQSVELPTKVHEDSCHSRGPADKRLPVPTPVLGVVEGQHTRAYPLDALAQAGLIRESAAGQPRVILWHEPTRTAAAYRPIATAPGKAAQPARTVTIELEHKGFAAPFIDLETGSRWDIAGRAVEGELTGWTLSWLDSVQVKWFAWAAEYPQTSIYGK